MRSPRTAGGVPGLLVWELQGGAWGAQAAGVGQGPRLLVWELQGGAQAAGVGQGPGSCWPHCEPAGSLPQVQWLEQQVAKRRTKRDMFMEPTDPKFPQQWYLVSAGDLNVRQAWEQGYTGKGIVVSILDDGIEKNHPDLEGNYDPGASFDVNDQDPDPQPRYTQMNDNRHGTRCAGEVAAVANNGICGVGVAYNARIGGGPIPLGLNPNHIHIYSASWGPEDDGKTVDGPARLAEEAFFRGVSQGRGGLGSIFVWASGNGGLEHDSCNCDGYTNSIYTTVHHSMMCLVPAAPPTLALPSCTVTTDLRQKCTESHTGTSASAPLAAGIIALALENLTWRDMQHLVVQTSKPAQPQCQRPGTDPSLSTVSHSYGYGLLDAGAMVSLAKNWTTVGPQRKCVIDVPHRPTTSAGWSTHRRALTLSYNRRGDLAIHLVSPMGTRSTLLAARFVLGCPGEARSSAGPTRFDPSGEWVLEIENTSDANNYGRAGLARTCVGECWGWWGGDVGHGWLPARTDAACPTVCEEGYYLHQKSCLKHCPPGFAPGVQSTHYELENSVGAPSPHTSACPATASCATCTGPGPNQCLTCPAHSHFSSLDLSCSHQTQSSRASPALAEGEGAGRGSPSHQPARPHRQPQLRPHRCHLRHHLLGAAGALRLQPAGREGLCPGQWHHLLQGAPL
uniref:furin n=1 Tax=Melopsittacus undulatus TaxID=13146 RepID=A0A8V5GXI6_MELUD